MAAMNTLSNYKVATFAAIKCFILQAPGENVIKLFTMMIYCHSMVTLSFCVKKLYYLGNYCGMTVNYHGIGL
jgi:hypothetical protein